MFFCGSERGNKHKNKEKNYRGCIRRKNYHNRDYGKERDYSNFAGLEVYSATELYERIRNKDRAENKSVTADAFCVIRGALGLGRLSRQKARSIAVNAQCGKREYNADSKKSDEYDRQCGFQFSVYVAPRQTVKQRPQYVREIFAEHFR